jgi:DNA repair protein SbcD/Mre11
MRNVDLAELIGDATRQALVTIVDLCIDEQVDALIIAGDLYDGDQTSMKTARFLASQMQRLHEAGIATFIIRGNHDALSRITQELILPPSVTVFDKSADAVELHHGDLALSIHGLSFAKPHAPESLLEKYHRPAPDAVNIGIMHTSLAGAAGHDLYAPCKASDLHGWGFDYWALGHVHMRAQHAGERMVIMPGMPQGRDINEAGAKTVTLVTVNDDRTLTVEERLTSRFNSGLIARIDKPCFETRLAILKGKARLRAIDLPDDVASYIASRVDSNIRVLEGALIRVLEAVAEPEDEPEEPSGGAGPA